MPASTSKEDLDRPAAATSGRRSLRAWLDGDQPEIPALCVSMIAFSFAVMFVHLGTKPFWVDESIAVLPAKSILTTGLPSSPFDLNYMAPQLEDGLWDPRRRGTSRPTRL